MSWWIYADYNFNLADSYTYNPFIITFMLYVRAMLMNWLSEILFINYFYFVVILLCLLMGSVLSDASLWPEFQGG